MKRVLTTLLLASIGAFAQSSTSPTRTPPTAAQMVANQVAHLTSLLTLTAAQQTQATTIFTTAQTSTTTVMSSLQTARTALTTAVEANDTASIETQTTAIGSLTAQQLLAQATAQAAFYLILTPTQQTQYAELLTHGMMGGPPHGPGDSGGPGQPH